MPRAKRAALRALELDPGLAEAHASLGLISLVDYDWTTAIHEFRAAIELKPDYATTHQWYAQALDDLGRVQEALAELERARELDPTSLIINQNLGTTEISARDYAAATAQLKKTLEMDPGFEVARLGLLWVYSLQGKYDDALAELDKLRLTPSTTVEALRAQIHALAGRRSEALRILRELEDRSRHEYLAPSSLGLIWLALGDKDRAFALFEKACAVRDSRFRSLKVDPSYDAFRSDPRFKDLLKCAHLE